MMRKFISFLRDNRGSVVVETALIAPVLALMSVGAFQVSQAVARQHELQTGADDAASLALAGWKQETATSPRSSPSSAGPWRSAPAR